MERAVDLIHLTNPSDTRKALCGTWTKNKNAISWPEATTPGGRHFTCGACHAFIGGGRKMVRETAA